MKRFLSAAAVVSIAVAILVSLTIQPAQLILPNPRPDGSVAGVLHIHTDRSDGHGSIDDVAAAAAKAGLKFVVITDHGDATAKPEPPSYRNGVLCIDAVEISTAGGHLLALDMPAAPYPLAGEPRDVVDDVHRLGGLAIAAHPDSPKPELRWRDWNVPIDGVETLNLDNGWRAWAHWAGWAGESDATPPVPGLPSKWRARGRVAAALLDYPIRPVETIASLIPGWQEPQEYAVLTEQRRVVSLAGADAHSRLEYRGDGTGGGSSLPIPGYEPTFRAMSVHVTPERALTGDPIEDTQLVMTAIRAGHLYTALDAVATPTEIEFSATSDAGTVVGGDEIRTAGPVTLRVRSNMPPDMMTVVLSGAKTVKQSFEQEFTVDVAEPGAYWVRITSSAPATLGATWIRTNPIYVRGLEPSPAPPADALPPHASSWSLFDGTTNSDWTIEHDPNSQSALDVATLVDGPALRLRYGLGGGAGTSPFVALLHGTPDGTAPTGRLAFTIRAEQPMRMWVQARVPDGDAGERWQRSIYIEPTPRDYSVGLSEMTPVGTTRTPTPPFSDVRSLLLVIDTVHTKPGASGRVWISNLRYEQ